MDSYRTLATPATARLTRERSRFLARIEPASEDTIEERLTALRREYHDATHVCSAFRCRDTRDGIASGSDDAGEPRGSAGLPILRQLEAEDLVNVLAIVVRHFGGVKLGIGGLARAYAEVVAAALARSNIVERQIEVALCVSFPTEVQAAALRVIHRFAARVVNIRYDTRGMITMALPPSRVASFVDALREATGARATAKRTG